MVSPLSDASWGDQNDRNFDSCYVLENMRLHISKHVKFCDRCQRGKKPKLKYGHIPPKNATTHPWKQVCVDLIGPSTVKAKDKSKMDFVCLTIIDPATSWFEIAELPHDDV